MRDKKVIIIGAGIAGLAAAMKLSTSGINVEVYEQHEKPGGKIRYFDSKVGPIDAGPTVLTMYNVFADLFHSCGCLLYTSPSPRDKRQSRMPSSA